MDKKIFGKLTVRTVKGNIKQFLSVILIVFLGVMLLSGFITNSYTLDKGMQAYFEDTKLAKTWLFVNGITADDEEFFKTESLEYDKRLYAEVNAAIEGKPAVKSAKVYVANRNTSKLSSPYIESGVGGCLIDKNVAKNNDISVTFDRIKFTIEYSGLVNLSLDMSFSISGTMSFDECADTYSSWPVFIDEDIFLAELNRSVKAALDEMGLGQFAPTLSEVPYNQVLLATDSADDVSKVENYYGYGESNSRLKAVLDRSQIESVALLNSEISQSKKMIYVFPVIFLVVSILVILTTIDQLILQEKQKIGTLKSIGIPDHKILRHYSKFGAILCFIGGFLGTVLGIVIIPKIMFIKYNLVYSIPEDYTGLKVPFLYVLLVLAGVCLLGYLVSLFACFQILHKKPIECLRFDVGANSKAFSKNKGRFKNVPLSVKMATRNIRLKPVRTIMAMLGIAGCTALLLCGFGIGDTLNYSVNHDYGSVFSYDVTTTYTDSAFEQNFEQVQGVTYFEKYKSYYGELSFGEKSKTASIYSVEPNSRFTSFKLGEGEAFLTAETARALGASEGDEIVIEVGQKQEKVKLTVLGETSVMNGLYVAKEFSFDKAAETNGMWLECDNPVEVAAALNQINGTNSAKTMQDLIDYADSKISSIDLMTTTLKTFAILLAVIVLLNLIFLILKERVGELATLKVLGKELFEITLSIYFEVLFMVIVGLVIGMGLGYPLLVLVLKVNKVEIVNFLYNLRPLSFILTALIVLCTQIIMTVFCFFKVKKVNMIESLKSME